MVLAETATHRNGLYNSATIDGNLYGNLAETIMSMRRIHKHRARSHLVKALEAAPNVAAVPDEWEDMVFVRLSGGQNIAIYFIDRWIDLDDVLFTFRTNSDQGIHTLYILEGGMFLPDTNTPYRPNDWMLALMQLYGGKLYNYRVMDELVDIAPVYFEEVGGGNYQIYYGDKIDATRLVAYGIDLAAPSGHWLIADTEGMTYRNTPPAQDGTTGYAQPFTDPFTNQELPLSPDLSATDPYAVLGISPAADREMIKAAFRALARRYHPDLDPTPGATDRMQALNRAYRDLMRRSK